MKIYDEVVRFHGHSCPGLALGYRVALRAMKELGFIEGSNLTLPLSKDEEIVAIVENDSCAVDALQVILGCTFGKGNLLFRDYGKQVYTIARRPSGEGVRISIDYNGPEESDEEREAWKRYMNGDRSEEVLRVVHSRKARRLKAILEVSDDELMKVEKIKIDLPGEARIFKSIRCELCGEKVAEPKARLRDGRILCIPCLMAK